MGILTGYKKKGGAPRNVRNKKKEKFRTVG